MKGSQLVLKCYAQRKGDQWVAFCLDFDLAVQADSLPDVRYKMHEMIAEYVTDALTGEDQQYADDLLSRRAPLYHYLKWYAFGVLVRARRTAGNIRDRIELFKEIMPLKPA
jgi:hypothetical protein